MLATGPLLATPQFPDRLMVGQDRHYVHALPSALRPAMSQKTFSTTFGNDGFSTACYRGYVAFWELRDHELHLTTVYPIPGSNSTVRAAVPLSDLFDGATTSVPAKWFTGTLRSPKLRIKRRQISHIGGDYFYHRLWHFEQGRLVRSTISLPWLGMEQPWFADVCYTVVILLSVCVLLIRRRRKAQHHNAELSPAAVAPDEA